MQESTPPGSATLVAGHPHATPSATRIRAIRNGVIAFVAVAVTAAIGSAATTPQIAGWYAGLNKPFFTPPNWVFGPAWTILFAIMGFAFWRILQVPAGTPGRTRAILVFPVQLVFNALWSVVFFGMQNPPAALIVVLGLELSVLAMIAIFRSLDPPAGWMNVPYALWVAFATALNVGVVLLN